MDKKDSFAEVSTHEVEDEDLGGLTYGAFRDGVKRMQQEELEVEDEDFGEESLFLSEEGYRQRELEETASPLIDEKVKEAVKEHSSRIKREAAELFIERDNNILSQIEDLEAKKKRDLKRKKRGAFIRGIVWKVALVAIIVICLTNNQVRSLTQTVVKNLYTMTVDLFTNEETSSDELVNDSLKQLGAEINEKNTSQKVVIVDDLDEALSEKEVDEAGIKR